MVPQGASVCPQSASVESTSGRASGGGGEDSLSSVALESGVAAEGNFGF